MKSVQSRNLLTRRNLLAVGVALGSAPALAAKAATLDLLSDVRERGPSTVGDVSKPAKLPKDRAHYAELASDPQKTCRTCKLFRAPAACLYVEGDIAPHCTCMLWAAPKAV